MNPTNLGKLLVLSRGVRATEARRSTLAVEPLRHLARTKPVQWGPVLPALSAEADLEPTWRWGGLAVIIGGACLGLGLIIAAGLFVFGTERVHHVREKYQLSVQLKQREQELHQAQRAYQTVAAFLAMQQARERETLDVQRVSFSAAPGKPAPKASRIRAIPAKRVQPCSKPSNSDV